MATGRCLLGCLMVRHFYIRRELSFPPVISAGVGPVYLQALPLSSPFSLAAVAPLILRYTNYLDLGV